jgi:hypothetical protein
LARIESYAFLDSSLQSIVIPGDVRFIDSSAFRNVELSSISIESGNERFVIREDLLINIVDHKLIRNFSSSPSIIIPGDIEILWSSCFSWCGSIKSVSFESNSRLTRIESEAFSDSSLQSIIIPRTVEILCSQCFFSCHALKSVPFQSNSRLTRIESQAFSSSSIRSIVIPRGVRFIDHSAFQDVKLSALSIERGNERFVIRDNFLFDIVDHKLIRNFSRSPSVIIPCDIEILCSKCFSSCESLLSVSF